MAMIATRSSGDSRCHFAIRISTSVAAEACAAELPRPAPRPVAHHAGSRGGTEVEGVYGQAPQVVRPESGPRREAVALDQG